MDNFRKTDNADRKGAAINCLCRKKTCLRVIVTLLLLAVCLTAVLSVTPDFYAEPAEIEDAKFVLLNDPGYLDFFSGNCIRNLEYGLEDGEGFARILLTPMSVDPFIYMPISVIGEGISCDEYPYVAISVRSPFESKCNLYFGTSNEGGLDEAKNLTSFNSITDKNDWETVVFCGKDNAKWTGLLTTARFDPYGAVPEGMEYIDIRWMAFVKNEKDLEKLDVSIKELDQGELFTRRPIYSTPNRTKPPENTFRPSVPSAASGNTKTGRGFSPAVLITVTGILVLCIAVSTAGIIIFKRKGK